MSKMDELRALREARYQQEAAGGQKPASRPPQATSAAKAPPAVPESRTPDPTPAGTQLCGHRSMNGRTCTREQGHTAKSHRYS